MERKRKQKVTPAGLSLLRARKHAGLSIPALVALAKVSPRTICNLERYGKMPGPMVRWKISQALGIPGKKLFGIPFPWEESKP